MDIMSLDACPVHMLELRTNFVLAFFACVLAVAGYNGMCYVRKTLGKRPESPQNGLEKLSKILVGKMPPKPQPISVIMSLGPSMRHS